MYDCDFTVIEVNGRNNSEYWRDEKGGRKGRRRFRCRRLLFLFLLSFIPFFPPFFGFSSPLPLTNKRLSSYIYDIYFKKVFNCYVVKEGSDPKVDGPGLSMGFLIRSSLFHRKICLLWHPDARVGRPTVPLGPCLSVCRDRRPGEGHVTTRQRHT